MMKEGKKVLFSWSVISIVMVMNVFFSSSWAAGSSGVRNLSDIGATGLDLSFIESESAFANPDNCDNSFRLAIDSNDNNVEKKFSIALTALTSGKKVSAWLVDCRATPWGYSIPKLFSITIKAE